MLDYVIATKPLGIPRRFCAPRYDLVSVLGKPLSVCIVIITCTVARPYACFKRRVAATTVTCTANMHYVGLRYANSHNSFRVKIVRARHDGIRWYMMVYGTSTVYDYGLYRPNRFSSSFTRTADPTTTCLWLSHFSLIQSNLSVQRNLTVLLRKWSVKLELFVK